MSNTTYIVLGIKFKKRKSINSKMYLMNFRKKEFLIFQRIKT